MININAFADILDMECDENSEQNDCNEKYLELSSYINEFCEEKECEEAQQMRKDSDFFR